MSIGSKMRGLGESSYYTKLLEEPIKEILGDKKYVLDKDPVKNIVLHTDRVDDETLNQLDEVLDNEKFSNVKKAQFNHTIKVSYKNSHVPFGYERLEYLESTGTQGITVTNTSYRTADCHTNIQFTTIGGNQFWDMNSWWPYYGLRGSKWEKIDRPSDTERHDIFWQLYFTDSGIRKCDIYIDKEKVFNANDINRYDSKLYFFHLENGFRCKCKIYDAKWRVDSTNFLFEPALDEVGSPCLYEYYSKKTYYNNGSGDYIYPSKSVSYSLRLPNFGKLSETGGLQRLYHIPSFYKGDIEDYIVENGFKPIIETAEPENENSCPLWKDNGTEIVLSWK